MSLLDCIFDLTVSFWVCTDCCKPLVEEFGVKRLTIVLLAFSVLTPSVFAQTVESVEAAEHRLRLFSAWLTIVKGAEQDYKNENGRYGDLAALRKAHFLRKLVFESDSTGPSDKAQAKFVPKRTLFQVTASEDGQHFRAVIGEKCLNVNADDMGREWSMSCGSPILHRDFEDSPEGPIISVAR
jgi:hypothetical protein